MGIETEGLDEVLDVGVQQAVAADIPLPLPQLRRRGQLAEDDEIGGFQVGAGGCQLLDGIAPVAQDALIAINVGDGTLGGSGVRQARIVAHQAEVLAARPDPAQIHGLHCPLEDGKLVAGPRAIVDDGKRVSGHGLSPGMDPGCPRAIRWEAALWLWALCATWCG